MSLTLRAALAVLPLVAGCAAGGSAPPATRLLAAVGLARKVEAAPARVVVELHAAPTLNAARDGVAVPTRVQLHWLRDPAAFLRTPYERFDDGADLVPAFEDVVVPGRSVVRVETAPRDARAVGVVVLFRAPAPRRWRYAFEIGPREPIRLSLHQCAIAVAGGRAIDAGDDAARIGDTPCPLAP